jgi:DNA-binding Xre family transcriptional regulator
MNEIHLKHFIKHTLGMSLYKFANQLDIDLQTINYYDQSPSKIPFSFIMKVCKEFDVTPEEILQYHPKLPEPLKIPILNNGLEARVKNLQDDISTYVTGLARPINITLYKEMESIYIEVQSIASKPNIAFLGPSDAGKSLLINSLTGLNTLVSKWTPATSATVLLKHIKDKPAWMGEDDVWIFKAESSSKGWDIQQSNNQKYCENLCIAKGKINVLEASANRNNKGKINKRVDSAVVYIDSPILNACNIIDSPGFGTEEESDTIKANSIFTNMDIGIFVCQSNSFLNKKDDISFLLNLVKVLSKREVGSLLLNLLIVASQAHIVGEDNLDSIFNRGSQAMIENYSIEELMNDSSFNEQFNRVIQKRFFSYSLERAELRTTFESALKYLLSEMYPSYQKYKIDTLVDKFKKIKNNIEVAPNKII